MRSLLIACLVGALAAAAVPVAANAHWHHPYRAWHHAWRVGPSYYPIYGFFDTDPYGPFCVWHREWDAYWHRDCL